MECMEARVLKSSFSSESAMKSINPQGFSDDFWCGTGLPGDDFSIDEFFDLPDEDDIDGLFVEEEEEKDSLSLSSLAPIDDNNSNSANFSPDLALPVDDVQELELWSHLMDDSDLDPNLACPNPVVYNHKKIAGSHVGNRFELEEKPGYGGIPFIPSAVPVKPRSKRPRTIGNRFWLLGLLPKTESPSSPSSPVSTLSFAHPVHDVGVFFSLEKPPMKKQKKKQASVDRETGSSPAQRRCSHCQVTKTPQWRAGPMGPKTLCNACGVRFKSGRLFPEYRPACSPTFSGEVHSNSHRKVLELRRKKEMESMIGLTQPVASS